MLPKWFKQEVTEKFEDFYPWLEKNWKKCNGVSSLNFKDWRELPYGIKRLQGLISFMNSEDWSERLPETAEWCSTIARRRKLNFLEIFPDLEWLQWYE